MYDEVYNISRRGIVCIQKGSLLRWMYNRIISTRWEKKLDPVKSFWFIQTKRWADMYTEWSPADDEGITEW